MNERGKRIKKVGQGGMWLLYGGLGWEDGGFTWPIRTVTLLVLPLPTFHLTPCTYPVPMSPSIGIPSLQFLTYRPARACRIGLETSWIGRSLRQDVSMCVNQPRALWTQVGTGGCESTSVEGWPCCQSCRDYESIELPPLAGLAQSTLVKSTDNSSLASPSLLWG